MNSLQSRSFGLLLVLVTSGLLVATTAFAQQPELVLPNVEAVEDSTPENEPAVRLATAMNVFGNTFNPTFGMRAGMRGGIAPLDAMQMYGVGFNNRGRYNTFSADGIQDDLLHLNIYHQPLIQVKLRIIEVIRDDTLSAKTILDYIRDRNADTRINQHNINQNRRRTTTSTRFPSPALAGRASAAELLKGIDLSGSGGIINVTSNQLNLIAEFLATEFRADLITCPQVVTLNGQRVQLLSGANVPFKLGQSVINDSTLAVQDTFYKHVGTNLTVIPRIVNWGPRGEGRGKRPICIEDVLDWNLVAEILLREQLYMEPVPEPPADEPSSEDPAPEETVAVETEQQLLEKYAGSNRLVNRLDQARILFIVNRHARKDWDKLLKALADRYPDPAFRQPLDCEAVGPSGCPCDWNPSHCTLDIEVVLRQSTQSPAEISDLTVSGTGRLSETIAEETVGAAISNVVQLKHGNGVVIAGLIGERDIRSVAKVPILGDIPYIGAAFRSTLTNRQKSEIVIFLEAEVLPSDTFESLAKASHDFELTRDYVQGDVLCNPLECGLQRVGFGSYLPPRTCHEKVYWERLGRKIQKSCTALNDTLR